MTTFLSLDAFLFFVAFEVTLVPGYFLIVNGEGPRRGYAATKFFLYTFAGSAFLFVGILATYVLASAHEPSGTKASFDIIALARGTVHLPVADQELLLLAFGVAFAVKMPLVPFHTWMPDAYTQAPTGGSMVLAGILFKLGAYGILRWGIFLFPRAAVNLAPLALTLAAIGIIWGSVVAAMQRDLKRLVAYGTVAGVGFIVIGLFGFTSEGITGGIVEMVNHGLSTGALFLLGRDGLGAPADLQLLPARGAADRRAHPGLGLHGRHHERHRPARAQRLHRRTARAAGYLHHPPLVGGGGDDRGGPRRRLPVVGLPARLPRPRPGHKPGSAGHDAGRRERRWRPCWPASFSSASTPSPCLSRIEPAVDHLVAHIEYADPSFRIPSQGVGHGTFAVPADQVVDMPAATAKADGGRHRGLTHDRRRPVGRRGRLHHRLRHAPRSRACARPRGPSPWPSATPR